jgi:hypothetical protein
MLKAPHVAAVQHSGKLLFSSFTLMQKKQNIKVVLKTNARPRTCPRRGTEKELRFVLYHADGVMHLRWFFSFAGSTTYPRTEA